MLLFQPDADSIATVKALLLSFELMSGLKINFHKCEMLSMGIDSEEGQRIANLLNCKMGKFPFMYLGLPLVPRRVTIDEWAPLTGKAGKKRESLAWQVHVLRGKTCPNTSRKQGFGHSVIFTLVTVTLRTGTNVSISTGSSG